LMVWFSTAIDPALSFGASLPANNVSCRVIAGMPQPPQMVASP